MVLFIIFYVGMEALDEENWDLALQQFNACYNMREIHLYPSHTLLGECMDNFARLYNAMGESLLFN